MAATFGWLCVETTIPKGGSQSNTAATFGWLCVETRITDSTTSYDLAATFGWLCVETLHRLKKRRILSQPPSRGCVLKLPAPLVFYGNFKQPPSRGCVLKRVLYSS